LPGARRRELGFLGRLTAACDAFQEIWDPRTGKRHSVRLKLVASGAAATSVAAPRLRSAQQSSHEVPQEEFRVYELAGYQPPAPQRGPLRIEFRVVAPRPRYATGGDGGPLGLPELLAQLPTAPDAHDVARLLVLVSLTGWDAAAVQYATGPGNDAYRDPHTLLVLYDAAQATYAARDDEIRLRPLRGLLQLESESERVARILNHLRGRLPLSRSLAAGSVAQELGVPVGAVETAFRLLSQEAAVDVEHLEEYGVVLAPRY
jgi:hypothetical protein